MGTWVVINEGWYYGKRGLTATLHAGASAGMIAAL